MDSVGKREEDQVVFMGGGYQFSIDPATIKSIIQVASTIHSVVSMFKKGKSDEVLAAISDRLDNIADQLDLIDQKLDNIAREIAKLGVALHKEFVDEARIQLLSRKGAMVANYDIWIQIRDTHPEQIILKLIDLQEKMLVAMDPLRGGFAHALLIADTQIFVAELMVLGKINPRSASRGFDLVLDYMEKAVDPDVSGSWSNAIGILQNRNRDIEQALRGGPYTQEILVATYWNNHSSNDGFRVCTWRTKDEHFTRLKGSIDAGFSLEPSRSRTDNTRVDYHCRRTRDPDPVIDVDIEMAMQGRLPGAIRRKPDASLDSESAVGHQVLMDDGWDRARQIRDEANKLAREHGSNNAAVQMLEKSIAEVKKVSSSLAELKAEVHRLVS